MAVSGLFYSARRARGEGGMCHIGSQRGVVVGHWESLDSLSLSAPMKIITVANLKGLTWTKATGAKNSEALVAQSCLLLLCQYINPDGFYTFCQVSLPGWILKMMFDLSNGPWQE